MAAEKAYTFQYVAAGFGTPLTITYPANWVTFFTINPYVVAIGTFNPYAQATLTDTGFVQVNDPNAPSVARTLDFQNNSPFYICADINALYDYV
jgi:hypothetical protein